MHFSYNSTVGLFEDSDDLRSILNGRISLNDLLGHRLPPGFELRIDSDEDYRLGVWDSDNHYWINVYWCSDEWIGLDPRENDLWQKYEFVDATPLDEGEKAGVATFSGGGVRSSDEDKPHFEQLQVSDLSYEDQPLTRAAQRMAEGAITYGARNHEKMNDREALERCYGSSLRHLQQLGEEVFHGTRVDNEDHLAAVICNMVMLAGIMGRLEK